MANRLFLIVFLVFGLSLQLTGCTSQGSKEEAMAAADSDFAEEGEGDFAEDFPQDEFADGGQQQDGQLEALNDLPPQDQGQDLALDDQQSLDGQLDGGDELALDDGQQALPDDVVSNDQAAPSFDSGTEETLPAPVEQQTADTQPPPAIEEPSVAPPVEESPSVADTHDQSSDSLTETASLEPPPATEAPKFVPVKKIADSAFERDGVNLNRVYIGRPGDTFASVSEKIFGTRDRANDLKAWNPALKGRIKTGDKVYYQSQSNPNDPTMLTFYEENGIQPNIYVSKEGDNIRTLSRDLLGDDDSWKEVWATNPNIESKGDIPSGIEIRYWSDEAIAQGPATPSQPAPPDEQIAAAPEPPPMPTDVPTELPPPPSDPMAQMNQPPSQDPNTIAAAEPPPPPPPPPPMDPPSDMGAVGGLGQAPEQVPPPPPPPPEPKPVAKKPQFDDEASANDPDTMMAMGVGGILLLAAAVLFVILRRNRAKRVDLGQTQV